MLIVPAWYHHIVIRAPDRRGGAGYLYAHVRKDCSGPSCLLESFGEDGGVVLDGLVITPPPFFTALLDAHGFY